LGGGLPLERDDHSVKDILPLAGLVLRTLPIHEAATFWLRAARHPDLCFVYSVPIDRARPGPGSILRLLAVSSDALAGRKLDRDFDEAA